MQDDFSQLLPNIITASYKRSLRTLRVLHSLEVRRAAQRRSLSDGVNRQAYSVADSLQKAKTAWRKACLALRSVDVPGDEHGGA